MFGFQLLAFFLEFRIHLPDIRPKVVQRTLETGRGQERMLYYIFALHFVSGFAREDHQLPCHINAAQVDPVPSTGLLLPFLPPG